MIKPSAIAISACLAVTGCAPIGTPGGSSYYECSQGTRLRVDYRGGAAFVKIGNMGTITLRQTPSTGGAVYEGRRGQRLERQGNGVMWNTAARTAPESCRPVMIPR